MPDVPEPTNDDIARLIESRQGSGLISGMNPVDLVIPRDVLETLTRGTLATMQSEGCDPAATEEQRASARLRVQQCIDLLEWLHRQHSETLEMSMYPAGEDGIMDWYENQPLPEEEMDDGSGDLPF